MPEWGKADLDAVKHSALYCLWTFYQSNAHEVFELAKDKKYHGFCCVVRKSINIQ